MELKDVLSYIGVEAENLEDLKTKFSEKFVPKSEVTDPEKLKSELTGKITGPLQTKVKTLFRLESEELKGLNKWEEIVELAAKKTLEREEELKSLSTQSNDGLVKELTEKLDRANKSTAEQKQAAQDLRDALEKKESEFTGKIKEFRTNDVKKNAFLKVVPKLSELKETESFWLKSQIDENVIIEFDDQEQPIVYNKEGKRWTDPNKVGSYLEVDQVIESIAAGQNLIKKNNASEQRRVVTTVTGGAAQQQNTERQLHPNAVKAQG